MLWKISFTLRFNASLSALTDLSRIVRVRLHKFKVAVNLNMVLLITSALTPAVAAGRRASYLLVQLEDNGHTLVGQANATMEAPVGSLLKPFAAWYLLEKGGNPQDVVFCPPEKKRHNDMRCWTPEGHGSVTLAAALVQSCNYFFLSRFVGRDLADYGAWLTEQFDWPADLRIRRPVNVYGFGLGRGIEAERLVHMYHKLLQAAEHKSSHAAAVRDALAGICRGTLADFCRNMRGQKGFRIILGKTGTVESGKRPFGIALLILEHLSTRKKIVLICYEREKTGAGAAMAAPGILSRYADKIGKSENLGR